MRFVVLRYAISAGLCWASFACGDDDSQVAAGDGGGFSAPSGAGYCDEAASWRERCDLQLSASDRDECERIEWSLIRNDFSDAVAGCFDRLECDGSDDDCTERGFEAIGAGEAALERDVLFQACEPRASECGFSSDRCYPLVVLSEAGRKRAMACVGMACDEVESCLEQLLGL
ncbi:MAG TPA: hypothetical protein VK509_22425 [Polyangiales bacterium]|nr:hypothetical protein [Polyangiales bacterium]